MSCVTGCLEISVLCIVQTFHHREYAFRDDVFVSVQYGLLVVFYIYTHSSVCV